MLEHVNTGIPGKNSSASYTPGAGYSVQGKGVTMRFETSDGKKGKLQWNKDMLASAGGAGGTVNARYHESSTAKDPVAVIWGTGRDGKKYRSIVHLNNIDPGHATPAEMIALNAHLLRSSGKNAENPIALWASKSAGANSKMDFVQYFKEYAAMQQQTAKTHALT